MCKSCATHAKSVMMRNTNRAVRMPRFSTEKSKEFPIVPTLLRKDRKTSGHTTWDCRPNVSPSHCTVWKCRPNFPLTTTYGAFFRRIVQMVNHTERTTAPSLTPPRMHRCCVRKWYCRLFDSRSMKPIGQTKVVMASTINASPAVSLAPIDTE